jgi:pyruvate/2-oxoacid:ferredoxin oxidoreductase alpha subunit
MQMEDELASIGAVMGARWAGKKAMTATSRAQNFMFGHEDLFQILKHLFEGLYKLRIYVRKSWSA